MKIKKLHRVLILTLIFAMMLTTFASAATISFSDVENSWAKDYIIKAAELGIIKGDAAGTFRPKDNVTLLETLIMLSRLYKVDDELQQQITDKYSSFMLETVPSTYSYAYKELSMALAINLVTEDMIKTFCTKGTLTNKATREEVAVLMTKAMMLKDEAEKIANTMYTLPFADAAKISTKARPYVYIMYQNKVMSGDNEGNLNPTGDITREQFAKMVIVAYDYITTNNVTPDYGDYDTYATYNGIITNVIINSVESYLEIELENTKESRVIRLANDSTTVKIDNKASQIKNLESGMAVECQVSEKTNIAKSVIVNTSITTVKGTIKTVYFSDPMKLFIYDESQTEKEYAINDEVIVTQDGKIIEFKNLTKSDIVTIKLIDNVVTRIDATSRIQTYSGKIKDIQYNIPIKLLVEDSTGKVYTFVYEKEPNVTRNSTVTTFDQLRVGDSVSVKTEYGVLTAIDATAVEAETTGVVKEITIGTKSKLKIQDNDGLTKEYVLNNNAKISVLNQTATIYDLRVGYNVSIIFDGNEIVSIEAVETETSQQIIGKVVYVNVDKKIIMLQITNENNENEIVYVNLNYKTIIMTLAAQTKKITDLKMGDNIISVGSYSGGTFNAVSIIIK